MKMTYVSESLHINKKRLIMTTESVKVDLDYSMGSKHGSKLHNLLLLLLLLPLLLLLLPLLLLLLLLLLPLPLLLLLLLLTVGA